MTMPVIYLHFVYQVRMYPICDVMIIIDAIICIVSISLSAVYKLICRFCDGKSQVEHSSILAKNDSIVPKHNITLLHDRQLCNYTLSTLFQISLQLSCLYCSIIISVKYVQWSQLVENYIVILPVNKVFTDIVVMPLLIIMCQSSGTCGIAQV